jgi:C1A family cysteine protease
MPYSFGWMRDLPDVRDYTDEHPAVSSVLKRSNVLRQSAVVPPSAPQTAAPAPIPGFPHRIPPTPAPVLVPTAVRIPASIDLRQWCSPIVDQLSLGSCTANACAGLIEYYEKRAFGKYLNASRLFIYKTTRDLLGLTGDTGAYLRSTMKALTLMGAPPEQYWPYTVSKFDNEPPAFTYAFASSYKAITYYRLDPPGTTSVQLLDSIKTKLAAGLPSMFGFTVYSSISNSPDIPFPKTSDSVLGGHAVMVVGYDDNHKIGTDTGALLIRNSWSTGWGNIGYGWLPYSYVLRGLASDFWSLVQASFVDTDFFK